MPATPGISTATPTGTITALPPKVSSASTTSKVSVGNTSTSVLSANANRALAILVNDSDEEIYVYYGATAVINEGIRLNAEGGSVVEDNYTGVITAICSSGSKNLTVTEL